MTNFLKPIQILLFMCNINHLKRTKDGILLFCDHSEKYLLLFKNINLNLTLEELKKFSEYIVSIDEYYWEHEYRNSIFDKHIPIPSIQENLMLLLDLNDLFELRELLNYKSKLIKFMSFREIDYKISLN